jgi:hypothetical protein
MSNSAKFLKEGETRTAYACATDFTCDIEGIHGINVYSELEDLKKYRKCIEECGWVKLELKVVEKSD